MANNEWQISGLRLLRNTCQVPRQEQELRWPLAHIHGGQCNKRPQDYLHRHFLPHCWRFWLVQCLANRHKFRKISGKSWNSAVHRGTWRLFLTCCNLFGCYTTLLQPCPQVQSSFLSIVTNVAKCDVGHSCDDKLTSLMQLSNNGFSWSTFFNRFTCTLFPYFTKKKMIQWLGSPSNTT